MRFRNRQRGFSLLEMMIVITLMIIIAAFATPTLVRTIRNYQMESAARQVSNTILSARYEAMRRNRRVCTLFQRVGNEGRYGLDLNGADRDPCDDGSRALTGTEPYIATNVTLQRVAPRLRLGGRGHRPGQLLRYLFPARHRSGQRRWFLEHGYYRADDYAAPSLGRCR
jgi:prepilin-type N-terminal cleavage/methylation domain-containing protein